MIKVWNVLTGESRSVSAENLTEESLINQVHKHFQSVDDFITLSAQGGKVCLPTDQPPENMYIFLYPHSDDPTLDGPSPIEVDLAQKAYPLGFVDPAHRICKDLDHQRLHLGPLWHAILKYKEYIHYYEASRQLYQQVDDKARAFMLANEAIRSYVSDTQARVSESHHRFLERLNVQVTQFYKTLDDVAPALEDLEKSPLRSPLFPSIIKLSDFLPANRILNGVQNIRREIAEMLEQVEGFKEVFSQMTETGSIMITRLAEVPGAQLGEPPQNVDTFMANILKRLSSSTELPTSHLFELSVELEKEIRTFLLDLPVRPLDSFKKLAETMQGHIILRSRDLHIFHTQVSTMELRGVVLENWVRNLSDRIIQLCHVLLFKESFDSAFPEVLRRHEFLSGIEEEIAFFSKKIQVKLQEEEELRTTFNRAYTSHLPASFLNGILGSTRAGILNLSFVMGDKDKELLKIELDLVRNQTSLPKDPHPFTPSRLLAFF